MTLRSQNFTKHTANTGVIVMPRRGRAQRLGMGDGRDRPCAACASLSLGSLMTQLSLELRCTCTQFGSDLKRRVWGLVASRLALTMISIKGATALATALATAAIIPAAALAFVLVLPWGVEDIIRADDLV